LIIILNKKGKIMLFNKNEIKLHYTLAESEDGFNNLILIHDNGMSSRIFDTEINFYSTYFNTVTFDMTAHGKSPNVTDFDNYWTMNASAILKICEKLKINKASIIGTGTGSMVAMNMALIKPGFVKSIIAESFPGISPDEAYIEHLISFREKIQHSDLKNKYLMCNGSKWEKILKEDTEMQIDFAERGGSFIHGSLEDINCPILLTGSYGYDLLPDIEQRISKAAESLKKCQIHFFSSGKYPTFLSKNDEFRALSLNYIME
jgi:pimeloyl-ACP methyl ester carboxylesterase